MRPRTLLASIAAAALAGGGILYAQPVDPPGGAGTGSGAAPGADAPDLSLPAEKEVKLSPQEMSDTADRLIREMEGFHRGTLELQAAAKQAKDVIKLNCVNENLLAVKQLLNIADEAKTDLTEAKIRGDRGEQVHEFSQITIANEKSKQARDEASACIGEELHFVGKNDLEVQGPPVRHDPTDDPDNGQAFGDDPFSSSLEDPAYASPFAPL
jgi:hypothetical protein